MQVKNNSLTISPRVFTAIQNVNISELSQCSQKEIRPLLPCLVRMSLILSLDITRDCVEARKEILKILSGIESVNSIVALLSIDFHALETDVRREQQLRQKLGNTQGDSILAQSLQGGLALEFERSESTRKIRLVLSELLFISSQIQENHNRNNELTAIKQSDLFDNIVYMEEISYVICIALAELPALLSIKDIAETLLHVKHGPDIICWVVANSPDSFSEVCTHLIANGERQEESSLGRIRSQTLTMLCKMNPSQALAVRTKCVELCRMPALAITLSLEAIADVDVVGFVSGLLLGNDQQVRAWIAMFIRNGQKRKWESHTALQCLRDELLRQLQAIISVADKSGDSQLLAESQVVKASALLRLYCALRGIGGIKFQDEEITMIVQLLTSHPPPSPAGVRFVSLGLCMLIACPSLIGHHNLEKKSIEWVQWLVKEEAYFENAIGVSASFGEMLLLMAIHFHSNQLSAICDLVCATLGMKIPIRPNNLTRMKQIFMQEIFTEQVVTAHAVKVPVTANLNANIPGFLPVHCIHQLLKSRAFAKHRVPIKNWIYRQICNSVQPLHPVLPALVEVYVNSILVINNKNAAEHTNKPITEDEIRRVFKNSLDSSNSDHSINNGTHEINSPHNIRNNFTNNYNDSEVEDKRDNYDRCKNNINNNDDIQMDIDHDNSELENNINKNDMDVDSANSVNNVADTNTKSPSLTSQLLFLYYLLLYEDVRLSNMSNFLAQGRKVKCYSVEFLAELPIKYLLQQAQRDQMNYANLFPPLLRLLATHYPHLSLVDDWIDDEVINIDNYSNSHSTNYDNITDINDTTIMEAFEHIKTCPSRTGRLLRQLMVMKPTEIWAYSETIIHYFKTVLDEKVPRYIQELYKQVWLRLNTVLPRCLWVMSINALLMESSHPTVKNIQLTQENIVLDPLQVLRCDTRVFRCAPVLSVILRILQATLAASRSQLSRHMQDRPLTEKVGQLTSETEREDLRTALIAGQESAAVQILLEACLETEEDALVPGQMWSLREIRSVICSYLHQVFISDPSLAKLVHFQGYPRELLPITVSGIPSMHICLDWIPELLSQAEPEKQIFAVDLASHLAVQYALPKALSVSRLAINTLITLLGVLPARDRVILFMPVLSALTRMCLAFPPLAEDITGLLLQLGRVSSAQAALGDKSAEILCHQVNLTFTSVLQKAILQSRVY